MRTLYARFSENCFPLPKVLLVPFAFLLNTMVFAQGDMRFFGTAEKDNQPLSGAVVSIYRGSDKITELTTGKNGKFKYTFDLGFEYKLAFKYPGAVDMFMTLNLKVPVDKMGIYPDYAIRVLFFDVSNQDLNLAKFKQPFAKVIFDGDQGFYDDPNYNFRDGLFIDKAAVAKAEAERRAKLEAEAKARAEAKAKEEARILAEKKAREEAELKARLEQEARERAEALELARLKAEAEKQVDKKTKESMESEIIRLEREKEAKALLAKKNREIKSKYENDLLKLVAENERIARAKEFSQRKEEAFTNSIIETMRREAELKAKADPVREREKEQKKKELENHQMQVQRVKALVEAAAFADRSIRINNQKSLPGVEEYKVKPKPNVAVSSKEELLKDVLTTTVTFEGKITSYRKETWFWGNVSYYKNDQEIDERTYVKEISVYIKIK